MSQAKKRSSRPKKASLRPRGAGREALLEAARAEFDRGGFDGTDSNRIARRAGYAPQTFYRHFADKSAIFVAVYERWLQNELRDVGRATARGPLAASKVFIQHHGKHRELRRSLRHLTLTDPTVRQARAASRQRQIDLLEKGSFGNLGRLARIALILCIERISDAAADGELGDLGLNKKQQAELLAQVIEKLTAV